MRVDGAAKLATLAIVTWLSSMPLAAATYHVRTDGGDSSQCTGLADAPYPGSGSAQPCAWNHPFQALPPGGSARVRGGDTLVISDGSYMMGFGAPGAEACEAGGSFDCYMPPIPSGPSVDAPTRVIGKLASAGCSSRPELWGTERANMVINLTDSSNVELACLDITDHSGCVEFHSGTIACNRDTSPYGTWAVRGLYAEDSSNVRLRDLEIHGFAATGIHAGRLADWTLENVRIAGNGLAGWDGDIDGSDSNSGTMRFSRWVVEWNGCGESWPEEQPIGCWAQSAGGYGDGVGTGETLGRWIIEDSEFLHNTSDGLDLLYARPGSSIEIRRTIAEGNAGNQLKTSGPALIENSIVAGNCGFFQGKPFTFNVDPCRAAGNALSITLWRGDKATLFNTTITSQGDCAILAECSEASVCDGSESLLVRNTMVVGQPEFLDSSDTTCLMYAEDFSHDPFDVDFCLVHGVKSDGCPGPHVICSAPPGISSSTISAFDAHLVTGSAAIDTGTSDGAPLTDFDGRLRDSSPDIGAYEWQSTAPRRRPVRRP